MAKLKLKISVGVAVLLLTGCSGFESYEREYLSQNSNHHQVLPGEELIADTEDPLAVPNDAGSHNNGSLKSGHHAKLSYLPQLDAIDFWETYHDFRALDTVDVKVAVLDGEFNVDHDDIAANVYQTYNFSDASCGTTIGQVQQQKCTGVFGDPSGMSDSQLGGFNHGTNIAGVIAGQGIYGEGVIGVNPSARLILLKRDSNNDNLRALKAAVESQADVISMSWPLGPPPGEKHVPEFEALLKEAVKKGKVVVMAAGNRGQDVNATAIYPTRYAAIAGVIAVAGTIDSGVHSASNFGNNYVGISAPWTVATSGGDYKGKTYNVSSGTSFSGPMVAAAASRVIQYFKAKKRTVSASEVEDILYAGSLKRSELAAGVKDGNALHMPSLLAELRRRAP